MSNGAVANLCRKCSAEISDEMQFCPKCGTRRRTAPESCIRCGFSLSPEVQYCPQCGTSVDGILITRLATDTRQFLKKIPESIFRKRVPSRQGVVLAAVIGVIALCAIARTHTTAYVLDQHPTYQANMATFMNVGKARGVDYEWPYQGHEDRLKVTYHADTSEAAGLEQEPTKAQLDQAAEAERLGFCSIRYRSGFAPDEAMQCQAYVYYENRSDAGYDGPETAPDRDASIKSHLDQVQ